MICILHDITQKCYLTEDSPKKVFLMQEETGSVTEQNTFNRLMVLCETKRNEMKISTLRNEIFRKVQLVLCEMD